MLIGPSQLADRRIGVAGKEAPFASFKCQASAQALALLLNKLRCPAVTFRTRAVLPSTASRLRSSALGRPTGYPLDGGSARARAADK